MPGGIRAYTYVWKDGKAPRYWATFWLLLLVFVLIWIMVVRDLEHFAKLKPDGIHSFAMMKDDEIRYYPPAVIWFSYYGLFIAMGWLLLLGIIMAFKRTAVQKGDR
jgi:hypothetical protein